MPGAHRLAGDAELACDLGLEDASSKQLLLEPDAHPAAGPFKAALVAVEDVHAEFQRLRGLGVQFTQEPAEMGAVTTAVFDDTCGNLIQIAKA
jgi:predicted enzyme related to lactoylglutathione lyase